MTTWKSDAVISGIMPDMARAGNVHFRYGYITTADDDMVSGDTLQLVPIPKNARVISLDVYVSAALTGATGCEIGDGNSNGRFLNGIGFATAHKIVPLSGLSGLEGGLGFQYTQDDTIDFFLRKTSTKVPTAVSFKVFLTYNIIATIADES
jgi:hypothetical protein